MKFDRSIITIHPLYTERNNLQIKQNFSELKKKRKFEKQDTAYKEN